MRDNNETMKQTTTTISANMIVTREWLRFSKQLKERRARLKVTKPGTLMFTLFNHRAAAVSLLERNERNAKINRYDLFAVY